MIIFPSCKINLGLFITSKRSDGFHNIETVFYPCSLNDALEIIESEKDFSFSVSGTNSNLLMKDNICEKAYRILRERYNLPSVKIHLHKNIPIGAGLGGGSSDGVSTLKLLNSLFNLNINENDMLQFSRMLGSDCAFFVDNKPKFAFEKGDVFESINISLKGFHLVLIVPPISVSTADAYKNVMISNMRDNIKNLINLDIEKWKHELYNDFEFTIFKKHPKIAQIKEKLYKSGAVYASMSGSGSSVFGIFKDKPVLESYHNCFIWQETCKI